MAPVEEGTLRHARGGADHQAGDERGDGQRGQLPGRAAAQRHATLADRQDRQCQQQEQRRPESGVAHSDGRAGNREQRERDRDDDRGYRSEHHSKRHDRDETDGRGYRTDGRETRREREKRKERERERDREREKPSRSSRRHDDDYDDRDRDRDRHDDRRRPSRRDRESSGGMLPKVKPKEMLEKGKKGWETAKPVAGPLLGTLAKAYLEKGH